MAKKTPSWLERTISAKGSANSYAATASTTTFPGPSTAGATAIA